MNSMKLVIPSRFISRNKSFSDISGMYIFPDMIRMVLTLGIFDQTHFLLTSENDFKTKRDGMTSFVDFM